MRSIAAIRTHRWGEAEDRLAARLRPVFGDDLCVVFHNRGAGQVVPVPCIDLTDAWVDRSGLRRTADYGWRCGDYSFYALREAMPGADHYWLIEPDVHFTSRPDAFFAACAASRDDGLANRPEVFRDQMRFTAGLAGMEPVRATFALTRLSGRAIDMLVDRRRALSASDIGDRFFPNDEFFVFSHLHAAEGFTLRGLEEFAPDWFEGTTIAPSPDWLLEAVQTTIPPGRVLHPVHDRADFTRALVARIVEGAEFLSRHKPSLAFLGDADLDSIALRVATGLRARLDVHRSDRALRRAQVSKRRRATVPGTDDG